MSNVIQSAISAALSGDWQKAISINLSLLKENKNDINSLSRLAHAYVQMGKLDQARKLYKKIIVIDKYNIIAQKNLDKLGAIPKTSKISSRMQPVTYSLSPSQFLEEPGKTKTVSLKNTAPAGVLSHLNPGTPMALYPKKHSIDIRTLGKIYIGALPDDLAFRLLKFLKAGYEYSTYVKNATKNNVTIFVRETKRAKRFKSQPSFVPASANQVRSVFHDHKSVNSDLEENEEKAENQEDSEE